MARTGQAAEYEEAARFLDALCRITELSSERVFLVPGNHDVDRTRVRLTPLLTTREQQDAFFADDEETLAVRELVWRRFSADAAFQRRDTGTELSHAAPWILSRCRVRGLNLAVLEFNSSWLHVGDTGVQGHLVVGERLVRQALARLERTGPRDLTVALLHDPLDWLAECGRSRVEGPATDGGALGPSMPPDLPCYLHHLRLTCGHLVLTGLLGDRAAPAVPLEAVFVPLRMSWTVARVPSGTDGAPLPPEEPEQPGSLGAVGLLGRLGRWLGRGGSVGHAVGSR